MTPAALARRAVPDPPPADLLRRFAASRDADAFAGLVRQFGPVVLGTCRRVLGPSADADDAFQAVFVALARQAGRFRDARSLPAWLHRVSLRTARKLAARRTPAPALADPADPADPFADVAWRDVRRVLDEELDRLPEAARGPVVLCLLDGLTRDEAAARLGVSLNTVKRRLDAGRELLRARLLRRGVTPVVVAAAALDPIGLRATVPPTLLAAAVDAARTAAPAVGLRWGVVFAVGTLAAGVGWAASVGTTAPAEVAAVAPETAPAPRPAVPAPSPLPPGVVAVYGSLQYRVPGDIRGAALSPDGKLLALGGNPVRVYDAATWRPVHVLPPEVAPGINGPSLPAFSPDGRYLGGVNPQAAHVWDLTTGRLAHRFDGGKRARWHWFCAFAPDGRFAVADEDRLYFYDPATGREVRSVPVGGPVVALSPDARHYVRTSGYKAPVTLTLADAATGNDLHTFDATVDANDSGVAFAPDGKTMTVLAGRRELHLWDVAARKKVAELWPRVEEGVPTRPDPAQGPGAGFTPDGKTVWMAFQDGGIARWDARTRKELPRLRPAGGPWLATLLPHPDGKRLLTPTGEAGWVRVWDAATGTEEPVPGRYPRDAQFVLTPDGRLVAAGTPAGRIDLLDAVTGKPVRTVREKGDPVRLLRVSPDGKWLGVTERRGTADGPVAQARVLNVADGAEVRVFHPDPADKRLDWFGIDGFLAGGRVLLQDRHARWRDLDLATGKERRTYRNEWGAYPSPDGRAIVVGRRGVVKLLDAATGEVWWEAAIDPPEQRGGHEHGFVPAWSGDGQTLAVGRRGSEVVILDPATGKERKRFVAARRPPATPGLVARDAESSTIWGLALNGDGSRLAAGGDYGIDVAVWDVTTGARLATLPHDVQIWAAAFAADGKSVLTFSFNGIGYRWDLAAVLAAGKK